MHALEDVGGRLGVIEFQSACRILDERAFVAQHLQQTQNAVPVLGRAEQHRADEAVAQFLGQIVEDAVIGRRNIGEQLLHQLVVVVGELFEHLEACFLLARGDRRRQLDDLALVVLAVDVGAFGGEIDKARRDAVFPDRYLAQHERLGARRLQARE